MKTIRIHVSDLYDFDGSPPNRTPDLVTITALVLKQFAFLPNL